jgi:hypothetical protein
MTLESKLYELTTLVDYGTYYLTKANSKVVDLHYIADNYDVDDVFDVDAILDFAKTYYYCFEKEEDVLDYVKDNFSIGEVYDEYDAKELLDGYGYLVFDDEDDAIDYIKHNIALGDVAEWN